MINPIFITLGVQRTALAGSFLMTRIMAVYVEGMLAHNLGLTGPADAKHQKGEDTRATQARPPCRHFLVDQYGRRRRDVNVERL